eukprot:CAMPEP_0196133016 /NCGR_PEP_ID=MMETSP0910-20130528/2412_1 /TAXON_ID=49265 /ORGANISM="Thalassiosira rotula, Strain GSO102" /LENGTH=68 /DNA_ID=CAMNT_0041392691 /DNA_START=6 /DNA_END=209 /DNA_ORIENTATION=+
MKFTIAQLSALALVAASTVSADFHVNVNSILSGAKDSVAATDADINSYLRAGKGSKSTSSSSSSSSSS